MDIPHQYEWYDNKIGEQLSKNIHVPARGCEHKCIPTFNVDLAFLTLFEDGTTANYRSSGQGITTEEEFWAARGPQLATRTADVVFMLDVITTAQNGAESALQIANPNPLWQRVDLSRIGVFGHSFGGATGIMALDSDPRIRAAVVLDVQDIVVMAALDFVAFS